MDNPFDLIDDDAKAYREQAAPTPSAPAPSPNPFDAIDDDANEYRAANAPTSAFGAGVRSFVKGVLPAAASLPAIEAGGEAGAAIGGFAGPVGATIGGIGGALFAGYKASEWASEAQKYALSKAPESWKEKIGLDDRQAQIDEKEHPYATFLGGTVPFALTMKPGAWKSAIDELPENATSIQRIMANPLTAHVFGGGAMGGMELGQEAVQGEPTDWGKVGIATGVGFFLNKPNAIGEKLMGYGGRPMRAIIGRPEPTVAAANDTNKMGEGVTEESSQGQEARDPESLDAARETRKNEIETIGPKPEPDIRGIVRQIEPELVAEHEKLEEQHSQLKQWIDEYNNPPQGQFDELEARKTAIQERMAERKSKEIDEREVSEGEYTPKRAKAELRDIANINAIDRQIDELAARRSDFESGKFQTDETIQRKRAELLDLQQTLWASGRAMRDVYARAGEHVAVEPIPAPVPVEPPPPPVVEGVPGTPSIEEQKAFIADDVKRQLIAAGRDPNLAEQEGALIAARYATRAGLFHGGQLGTPQELYLREGARITSWEKGQALKPTAEVSTPTTEEVVATAEANLKAIDQEEELAKKQAQARGESQARLDELNRKHVAEREVALAKVEEARKGKEQKAPVTEHPSIAEPVAAPAKTGPAVGDKITMAGTKYSIIELTDTKAKLQEIVGKGKTAPAPLSFPRAAVEKMLGEFEAAPKPTPGAEEAAPIKPAAEVEREAVANEVADAFQAKVEEKSEAPAAEPAQLIPTRKNQRSRRRRARHRADWRPSTRARSRPTPSGCSSRPAETKVRRHRAPQGRWPVESHARGNGHRLARRGGQELDRGRPSAAWTGAAPHGRWA